MSSPPGFGPPVEDAPKGFGPALPDQETADLHAKAGYTTTLGAPPSSPGFISRSAEALGIPTSMDELKGMFTPQPVDLLGPGGRVAQTVAQGLTQPMTPQEKADMAVHPVGQVANQIAKRTLEGPLAPIGGTAVSNIATDKGNLGAQAGDVLGTLANLFLLKGAKGPRTEGKLAYSTGGEARNIMKAAPDILKEVQASGRPADLNGLIDGTIKNAKDKLNLESSNALGPIANQQIMPSAISRRLLSLITPNMDMTQPGKALKRQIQSAAVEFQKPWTLAQLDQERMDANARLHNFEKKGDVDQYAATRGNNRNAPIDRAIANGVREEVYPLMDQAVGKPPGYFANVKDRIGALMNLESDAKMHREDLRTKALKMEGAPLMERLKLRGMATGEGHPRFYVSNLLGPSDPLEAASSAAKGAFAGPGTNAARVAALLQTLQRTAPNHPLVQQQEQ